MMLERENVKNFFFSIEANFQLSPFFFLCSNILKGDSSGKV